MVLVGTFVAVVGMDTVMRHWRGLLNLMDRNMRSAAAAHRMTSMYSEALPPVATIVNMGCIAAAAYSRSEVWWGLPLAEARLRSTDRKSQVGMEAHRHSSGWKRVEEVLRPWHSYRSTFCEAATPRPMILSWFDGLFFYFGGTTSARGSNSFGQMACTIRDP